MKAVKGYRVVIRGRGHRNIKATHRTTIMFTRDEELTPRGDCIVLVGCDKSLADFPKGFVELARRREAVIVVEIHAANYKETIIGRGDPSLTYKSERDIVIRKSSYTCPRTLAINADKAACDISRDMVNFLRRGVRATVEIRLHFNSRLGQGT